MRNPPNKHTIHMVLRLEERSLKRIMVFAHNRKAAPKGAAFIKEMNTHAGAYFAVTWTVVLPARLPRLPL